MSIYNRFVLVTIDKATGNSIALICKQFNASVIEKNVRIGLSNRTYKYSEINNASKDEIININIEDLKSKFSIDNIFMDNHCLPNMYWLPKVNKTSIKATIIVVSPKSSINPKTARGVGRGRGGGQFDVSF